MGRVAETAMSELLSTHTSFKSATDLGKAIGEPTLADKLRHNRQQGQLPSGSVIRKIQAAFIEQGSREGSALVLAALATDAGLTGVGYESEDSECASLQEQDELIERIAVAMERLRPKEREAWFTLLNAFARHHEQDDVRADVSLPRARTGTVPVAEDEARNGASNSAGKRQRRTEG